MYTIVDRYDNERETWSKSSAGSANTMNKLSLVGMQLPEKYKDISTFRALRLELLAVVGKIT
jgi:hypothetical protein